MSSFRLIAVVAVAALTVLGLMFVTGVINGEFLESHAVKLGAILAVLMASVLGFKLLARGQKTDEPEKPPVL